LSKLKITSEDLGKSDYDLRTPLHLAACNGHLNIVKFLVENVVGININCIDRWGGTPYDDSLREKQDEVSAYLKSVGGISG